MAATGLSRLGSDILFAAIVLLSSLLLSKAVKYFLENIAPELIKGTKTTLDDELFKAVNGPLQVFIVAFGIYLVILAFEGFAGSVALWLDRLMIVGLICIFAYLVTNVIQGLLNWYKNDVAPSTLSSFDDMIIPFLKNIVTAVVATITILVTLEQLNIIAITPLITGLGIVGIAAALAAQELLSNFFGSLSILMDRPYKVGNRVKIQGIDSGDVLDIGLRSTRLRTTDGRILVVPNIKVSKSHITNYSTPDDTNVYSLHVGIAYDADVEKARKIIKEVALSYKNVVTDPEPKVYVTELGDFSVNLELLVCFTSFRLDFVSIDYIYKNILKRFEEEGIEIPYPIKNVMISRSEQDSPVFEPLITTMISKP